MGGENPFRALKSRLGRELYTLAAILGCAPLILIGTISLYQIDSAHRSQAERALDQSIRSFGEMIFERLRQSNELAIRLIEERLTADELPHSFLDYAVLIDGEIAHSTFADAVPELSVTGTAEKAQIVFTGDGRDGEVLLAFTNGTATFIGRLDQFYLWGDRSQYPFATEFCIIARAPGATVFCSTPLPRIHESEILSANSTRGSFGWKGEDQSWRAGWWELFLPSAFEAEPLRIVASQPTDVAFAAADTFRLIYIPGLIATLAITLLGAGYHARRYLTPLSELLKVTRQFASRDFKARAALTRNDEFSDLAEALNDMADALDRQFRQREALSRLDYLILAGDSIEDVFRTAVTESLCYLPFDEIELDIEALPDGRWFRYAYKRGDEGLSKSVLSGHSEDTTVKRSAVRSASAISSIVVSDVLRGEMRAYFMRANDSNSDNLARQQLTQLADRLSMALEFDDKSAELNRRAYFDELTGLPNRETCFQKINRAIETADFNGHMVALLYIDLDGFKSVNDSLGHDSGDQLIKLAADRITRCVGHHGVTARLGGDEFAVIIPYSSGRSDDYKTIGAQILAELQSPFTIGNTEAFLGASIGTARYPDDGNTHTELLRKADAAMYRAKDTGRGRQVDYSRTLGIVIAKRLRLEADLNRALDRDEMYLVYQSQVSLATGVMNGAEALLRWNHSTEGPIAPDEFIPIAEETNQIITLGNWVLFNACRQFSEWLDRGLNLRTIAINVSANQLRSQAFLDCVRDCLDRFEIKPEMLELELTERVFVGSHELTSSIHSLKTMGVQIAIDDFGTGYSALGYLKNLEFDKVKIDRSFVGSLPHDRQAASIIQAVLAMCETLGKTVVAEGVETSQQLKYLAEAGVDIAQGYYFGKPLPAQEFEYAVHSAREASDNTLIRLVNLRDS